VECVGLIILGDEDRWAMPTIEASAKDILKLAIESNVPEAALDGRHLVQDLFELRHYDFRTLRNRVRCKSNRDRGTFLSRELPQWRTREWRRAQGCALRTPVGGFWSDRGPNA
jgi:hypothetical protein